jgi:hypothetical protein
MILARVFWPLAAAAALAACSGEVGGGQSTLPGTMPSGGANVQQIAQATATPTPVSASNVATVGENIAPQALPTVMGWGGTIAFPKPTAATPNPKSTATPAGAATPNSTSVGITAAVVEPTDAPAFGTSAKHRAKREAGSVDALLFISLLATADVTLAQYPTIAVDVPRDVAAKHRDDIFALALYDSSQNDKSFRLAVADRDLSSPAPGSMPSWTPGPTPMPTVMPIGMVNGPGALTPPPVGAGIGASTLPPERVAFKPTAQGLVLKANRPLIFALYAIAPSPSPSPSAAPKTSPSPRASGLASPAAPAPGSSAPPAAPSPAPSPATATSPAPLSPAPATTI